MGQPKTVQELTIDAIRQNCQSMGLDSNLAQAIAYVESNLDPTKVRYEPNWTYLVNPARYALNLGISVQTETQLQKFSWGPMQIMGSNARSLGYTGTLILLVQPQLGILYALKYLEVLHNHYQDEGDIISAYNQGEPTRINGEYRNLDYVTKVVDRINLLRRGDLWSPNST